MIKGTGRALVFAGGVITALSICSVEAVTSEPHGSLFVITDEPPAVVVDVPKSPPEPQVQLIVVEPIEPPQTAVPVAESSVQYKGGSCTGLLCRMRGRRGR